MNVPIEKKYFLTVAEAVKYSNIGENKVREIIKDPACGFIHHVGKKALIHRQKFEKFLDENKYL